MGHAGVLHDGGDVRKVQVDKAGVADEVRDGLHSLAQHIVCDLKGVGKGDLLVGGVLQALVGDDDKRIHLVLELVDAGLSGPHAAGALKAEGLGDHANSQDAHFLGDLGNDGRAAGAGAAAHAGGDEDHIRIFQSLGDLSAALLGSLAAHLGVSAGALAVGQLLADLDLISSAGHVQCLLVRIHGHKIDALSAGADHAVDNVVAAAAHADDLNIDNSIGTGFQSKCHNGASCNVLMQRDKALRVRSCVHGCHNNIWFIVRHFGPAVKCPFLFSTGFSQKIRRAFQLFQFFHLTLGLK